MRTGPCVIMFGGSRPTEARKTELTAWLSSQLSGTHSTPAFKPGTTLNYKGACTNIPNKCCLRPDYHSIRLYLALDYAKYLDLLSTHSSPNIPIRAHRKAVVRQFQSSYHLTIDVQRSTAEKSSRDS